MKALIVFLGILILQEKFDRAAGQSTASTETGSGGEIVTTPAPCTPTPCGTGATCYPDTDKETYECRCDDEGYVLIEGDECVKDPCTETSCEVGETCIPDDSGTKFTCKCDVEGYILTPELECVAGCKQRVDYALNNNTVVNQNFDCAGGLYNTSTGTIYVTFASARVGDVSRSNETCDPSCSGVDDDKNFGYTKCVIGTDGKSTWSQPEWTNCSDATKTVGDTIIATDPETMDESDVDNAVKVIETTTAGSTITSESADDVLTITNNLLLAETDTAKASVKNNSKAILDSVDSVANTVVLTDDSYEEEKSDVALAVVRQPFSSRVDETFYYGPAGEWDKDYNLAASSLTLTAGDTPPPSSYISGKTGGPDRISFKIYASTSGLFDGLPNGVSDRLVLSANGTVQDDYTFRFRINTNISLDTAGRFNISQSGNKLSFTNLQCVRWDRGTGVWDLKSQPCYASTAKNFFATCKCSEAGEYSVRTINDDEIIEAIEEGLSGGAIAGIVIGSVVGAALIGGGIYYFCFYKKQKKRTAVTPTNDIELHGNDNVVTDHDED